MFHPVNISSRMLKTDPPKSFSDAMFVLAKADTARSLIHDWNTNIESIGEEVKLHNAQLIQDFRDGKLHPVAFQKGLEPLPKRLKEPSKSWCQWFRQAWGWSMLSRSSDTQAWLSYDHPDMVMAREAVRELETVHGCHDGMIINCRQTGEKDPTQPKIRQKGSQHQRSKKGDDSTLFKVHGGFMLIWGNLLK